MNDEHQEPSDDEAIDDEPTPDERADAIAQVEAFTRWQAAAEEEWHAAAALLAYRIPDRYWPPPEGVTLADVTRWSGASPDQLRRWFQINPGYEGPPAALNLGSDEYFAWEDLERRLREET